MTPCELNIRAELYNEKFKIEREEKFTLAYAIAAWQRTEKLEPLDQILKRLNGEKEKQMSDLDMLIKVQQLNAAMGGNVK